MALLLFDHESGKLISQLGSSELPGWDMREVLGWKSDLIYSLLEFAGTAEDLQFFKEKLLESGFLAALAEEHGPAKFPPVVTALYQAYGRVPSQRSFFATELSGAEKEIARQALSGESPPKSFAEGVERIYALRVSTDPWKRTSAFWLLAEFAKESALPLNRADGRESIEGGTSVRS
jgi:hypothetical protein